MPIDSNTTWDELHRYLNSLETKLNDIRIYLHKEYRWLDEVRDRDNLTEYGRGQYEAVVGGLKALGEFDGRTPPRMNAMPPEPREYMW